MAFTWDDKNRAAVVEQYQAANPTPENSMEIVKQIAEEIGATPNGVRTILTKAKAYIKKEATSGASASTGTSTTKRVSKADALATLHTAIESTGQTPDDEITSKLTGKAALYFAGVINNINQPEEE